MTASKATAGTSVQAAAAHRLPRLSFTKMQGLGNDFVVLDGVRQGIDLSAEQVRRLADRHFGIGFDQMLIAAPATMAGADYACRIYNADGGAVEHCGNGVRCMARFLRDTGLIHADTVNLQTGAGPVALELLADGQVRVDMGAPRLTPPEVPFEADTAALDYALEVDGQTLRIAAVGMGNPHAVLRVPDVTAAPVTTLGPRIEHHPRFPQRVNAGFLEIRDRRTLHLRVWERGAGATLACGTGACAAAVAAIRWGLAESELTVHLPGGPLTISWAGPGTAVWMTGPAITVYQGSIEA